MLVVEGSERWLRKVPKVLQMLQYKIVQIVGTAIAAAHKCDASQKIMQTLLAITPRLSKQNRCAMSIILKVSQKMNFPEDAAEFYSACKQ